MAREKEYRVAKANEIEKRNEVFEVTEYSKKQLFLEKKKKLPSLIKKRKKQFLLELEQYNLARTDEEGNMVIADKTLPMVELTEYCFSPFVKSAGVIADYTPSELEIIFDYFKQCIKEMNKDQILPPTKEMFCQLCDMSTQRFNDLKNTGDSQMREMLLKIEDYICNYLSIGGLTRKISEVSSIFGQKVLGRREAGDVQAPPQNNTIIVGDDTFMELANKYLGSKQ